MRILYVLPGDLIGGAERQGVVQIRGLRALGVDVIPVIGGPEVAWLQAQLERAGATDYVLVQPFPHLSTGNLTLRERVVEAIGNARALISARKAVEKLARERRVDLVLANSVHAWVLTGSVLGRARRPLVWRAGTRLGTRAQRVAVGLVASVLRPSAVLPNCQALLRELQPLVDCPTHLVPNGIEIGRFDPAMAVPRFRRGLEGRPIVGIVTRPQPEKGMELLADVIATVAAKLPSVQFLIAGDGVRRAEFEARFRRRRLDRHALFVGHVDDVENFYASCDVMILTSRSRSPEASSNALLEAMAMERPVVATRVCGAPEMIEDGREGWLVGETDVAAFADRILLVLSSEPLRKRLGSAGRAQVQRRFDEKQSVRRLADILRACAGQERMDVAA